MIDCALEHLRRVGLAPMCPRRAETIVLSVAVLGGFFMKTFMCALIAVSVVAGVAAPASAFDAKAFFEQLERSSQP